MKKILRALYMIITTIILWPIIVLVCIAWLGFLWCISKDFKKAARAWVEYIVKGIEMNIDFVKNGF